MTLPRRLPLALACLSLLTLAACGDNEPPPAPAHTTTTTTVVKPKPTPTTTVPDDGDAASADATPPPERPRATPAAALVNAPPKVDYPYGVPVQGKPGYVTSPYSPDSGYVDVHGFTPGQEVRDPYTQKIFLVP